MNELNDWADAAQFEIPLSDTEKALRARFVDEYFVDYNYIRAAIRCGFPIEIAKEYGERFQAEPYVQQLISQRMAEMESGIDGDATRFKNRILNQLIREANYNGPGASHAARVSALSKLVAIQGMDAPIKTETTVTNTHAFDFSSMNAKERGLLRQLLESRTADNE